MYLSAAYIYIRGLLPQRLVRMHACTHTHTHTHTNTCLRNFLQGDQNMIKVYIRRHRGKHRLRPCFPQRPTRRICKIARRIR